MSRKFLKNCVVKRIRCFLPLPFNFADSRLVLVLRHVVRASEACLSTQAFWYVLQPDYRQRTSIELQQTSVPVQIRPWWWSIPVSNWACPGLTIWKMVGYLRRITVYWRTWTTRSWWTSANRIDSNFNKTLLDNSEKNHRPSTKCSEFGFDQPQLRDRLTKWYEDKRVVRGRLMDVISLKSIEFLPIVSLGNEKRLRG